MDIKNILLPNEQILYKGAAVPKKSSKNILGSVVILIYLISLLLALIDINTFNFIGLIMQNVIIIVIVCLILVVTICNLIYTLFLKNNKINNQQYFITNQRAIIYSKKNTEYKIGYLNEFDDFVVNNEKNNIGDVYMKSIPESNYNLFKHLFKPDKNNMSVIVFEAVENPHQILEMVKTQRIKLNPNQPLNNDLKEDQTEVKVGGQHIIVYNNPKRIWLLFIGIIIILLIFPIFNIFHTLKVWNNYTKINATIINIDRHVLDVKNNNIKYFVDISYVLNEHYYESVITNDKCYLKSIQSDSFATIYCNKYDNRFNKMKNNDKLDVYVNPDNLVDIEFIPTLISNMNLILLLFGIISGAFLIPLLKARKLRKENPV